MVASSWKTICDLSVVARQFIFLKADKQKYHDFFSFCGNRVLKRSTPCSTFLQPSTVMFQLTQFSGLSTLSFICYLSSVTRCFFKWIHSQVCLWELFDSKELGFYYASANSKRRKERYFAWADDYLKFEFIFKSWGNLSPRTGKTFGMLKTQYWLLLSNFPNPWKVVVITDHYITW